MLTPPTLRPNHIIVMGVSGCGKSTLAHALALQLNWPLIEGDDFHPPSNLKKMALGHALNDEDRQPWLAALNAQLRALPCAVLACSALKAAYRRTLRSGIEEPLFVHCEGSFTQLEARLRSRSAHFMPPSLLQSQFDALEPPSAQLETGLRFISINIQTPLAEATARVCSHLK